MAGNFKDDLLSEQARQMYRPFCRFNEIIADSIERMTDVQLTAFKAYTGLAVSQLRAASKVEDGESAQLFGKSQMSFLNDMGNQFMNDTKQIAQVSSELKTELDDLIRDSLSNFNTTFEKANEQIKKSAKTGGERTKKASVA